MASVRFIASGMALRILRRVPFVKGWAVRRQRLTYRYPPGHFYSPIPDVDQVLQQCDRIFPSFNPSAIAGVHLRADEQLRLLEQLALLIREQPFSEQRRDDRRYYFDNPYFRHADGLFLYAMLRQFKPERVVEIGSGFSSAVMLDTDERFLDRSIQFTFVEPNPQRLHELLRSDDLPRVRVMREQVQQLSPEVFQSLAAGDFLFVDSSHVAKVGSDVNHLIFEVLPRLADGVIIHVHDIFYPFQYPQDWIVGGLAWNEAYLLRAFLMFNDCFEILLFNDYLARMHGPELEKLVPLAMRDSGGSLWLRKRERTALG